MIENLAPHSFLLFDLSRVCSASTISRDIVISTAFHPYHSTEIFLKKKKNKKVVNENKRSHSELYVYKRKINKLLHQKRKRKKLGRSLSFYNTQGLHA